MIAVLVCLGLIGYCGGYALRQFREKYKNIWIDQFRKMSRLAYQESSLVTSLFEQARQLQIELGCPPEKTVVTPNGIRVENLQNLAGKQPEDEEKINIGAVLRVTPIKDVKTMIQAFGFAKQREPLYCRNPDCRYSRSGVREEG